MVLKMILMALSKRESFNRVLSMSFCFGLKIGDETSLSLNSWWSLLIVSFDGVFWANQAFNPSIDSSSSVQSCNVRGSCWLRISTWDGWNCLKLWCFEREFFNLFESFFKSFPLLKKAILQNVHPNDRLLLIAAFLSFSVGQSIVNCPGVFFWWFKIRSG